MNQTAVTQYKTQVRNLIRQINPTMALMDELMLLIDNLVVEYELDESLEIEEIVSKLGTSQDFLTTYLNGRIDELQADNFSDLKDKIQQMRENRNDYLFDRSNQMQSLVKYDKTMKFIFIVLPYLFLAMLWFEFVVEIQWSTFSVFPGLIFALVFIWPALVIYSGFSGKFFGSTERYKNVRNHIRIQLLLYLLTVEVSDLIETGYHYGDSAISVFIYFILYELLYFVMKNTRVFFSMDLQGKVVDWRFAG